MSILRQRMHEDMTIRGLAPATQKAYLKAVERLAIHYGKRPDRLSSRDIQRFLLYLHEKRGLTWGTLNTFVNGLRFFYHITLGRPETAFRIPCAKPPKKLPRVLSRQEVIEIFAVTTNLRHRTLLKTTYSAGLRVSETINLKVTDIDSHRMCIRVDQGTPQVCYSLLFRSAAATMQTFGRDLKWLGGEFGITMVLHTWSQTLDQHLHVHCIVTGGALDAAQEQWIATKRRDFLFPVRALSKVFRAKYLAGLQAAFPQQRLQFGGATAPLAEARVFAAWLESLRAHDWVVYAKPPFAGPRQVVSYLGRYTHRVAISNERLVALKDDQVLFQWRDARRGNRMKAMALGAEEFLRRFLLLCG